MDLNSITLHPEFPQKVWVTVEQPKNEPHRFSYDPASQTFSRSPHRSLIYDRGFGGVYGWIGGTGVPPAPRHDVLLFTSRFPAAGEVLLGHICGVFLRRDNDHKFVAVDDQIRANFPPIISIVSSHLKGKSSVRMSSNRSLWLPDDRYTAWQLKLKM